MSTHFLLQVADGEVATETARETTLTMWQLIMEGGASAMIIIGIIFILSILAVYIYVERTGVINNAAKLDKDFINRVKDLVAGGKIAQAKAACKSENTAVSRLLEKGIDRIGKPLEDISLSIENAGKIEIYNLEQGVSRLAIISGISPMLGFLGTVVGMIIAFHEMAAAGGQVEMSQLSGGISAAMTTTVAGLIVGIMAYVFYNLLVGRINKIVNQLEVTTTEFLDLLNEPV